MKYKIITARTADSLEELVNNNILGGWKPVGGVCFAHAETGAISYSGKPVSEDIFFQAMIFQTPFFKQ